MKTRYLLSVHDRRQGIGPTRGPKRWCEPGLVITLSVVAIALSAVTQVAAQSRAFDAKELAEYRLTVEVFERFVVASDGIAIVSREDQRLSDQPLFTREVSVLGDAPVMARDLEARLSGHDGLARALSAARITAREYATFALTLFGARLAHGFLSSGALRSIPKGVASDNVQFVETHLAAVTKVLQVLGVEEPAPASHSVARLLIVRKAGGSTAR